MQKLLSANSGFVLVGLKVLKIKVLVMKNFVVRNIAIVKTVYQRNCCKPFQL